MRACCSPVVAIMQIRSRLAFQLGIRFVNFLLEVVRPLDEELRFLVDFALLEIFEL